MLTSSRRTKASIGSSISIALGISAGRSPRSIAKRSSRRRIALFDAGRYRNRGSYTVDKHEFAIKEFEEYVANMVKATIQFQKALAADERELAEFANSAV
jgi:hypothetical protein